MRILMVGDVVGQPGRKAFAKHTPRLKAEKKIDLVVVNGENAAHGKGLTRQSLDELIRAGADVITTGNHIWDKRDVLQFIDEEPYLVRPGNYPEGTPGKGWCVYPHRQLRVGVMNLSGRVFMPPMDCPFQKVEDMLREMQDECDIILLDLHAETTSEKMAMGWYLDGRVQAVVGTHTHIQTADERILPQGTAYITDLGMVGPWNSVLGVQTEKIIEKFTSGLPVRFDIAEGPTVYSAVLIEIDNKTRKAVQIERVQLRDE